MSKMKTGAVSNGKKPKISKGTTSRLIKTLFEFYPVMLPITLVCIVISAVVGALPSLFMQKVISLIESAVTTGDWNGIASSVASAVILLAILYVISLAASVTFNQLMAVITQGSLKKFREKMFGRMRLFP